MGNQMVLKPVLIGMVRYGRRARTIADVHRSIVNLIYNFNNSVWYLSMTLFRSSVMCARERVRKGV